MPLSLISAAVGQVLLQHASHAKNQNKDITQIFLKTTAVLVVASLSIFIPLYFAVEYIFEFVFGAEWRVSGQFAKIMMPLFVIQFVVSPLTSLNIVNERNRLAMTANLILLTLTFLSAWISFILDLTTSEMLLVLTSAISLYYFIYWFYIFKHVREATLKL